jgi:diguanylate cyclase (GGDEF)-like protein
MEALVALYALGLATGAVLLAASIGSGSGATVGGVWLVVGLVTSAFFIAELKALEVFAGRQGVAISLTPLALVFAVLLLDPVLAVLARVVAGGIFLALSAWRTRRTGWLKSIWNLSMWAFDTAVAAAVVRWVVGGGLPEGTVAWSAVLMALVASEVVQQIALVGVMAIYGRSLPKVPSDWLGISVILVLSACFAVTIAAAWAHEPTMLVYAAVPVGGVALLLKLHGRLNQAHRDLEDLHRFSRALEDDDDAAMLARLATAVSAAGAVLVLEDHRSTRVVVHDERGPRPVEASCFRPLVDLEPGATRVTGASHPDLGNLLGALDSDELLTLPLLVDDRPIGAVAVFGRVGTHSDFTDEEVALFTSLARTLAARVVNDRLSKRDHLTGLPDREAFTEALSEALGSHDGGALVQLDLIRFREVNESLGHAVGDQVLIEVANRLLDAVRSGDVVARLGSDEFAVLFDGVLDAPGLLRRAEALRAKVCTPFQVHGLSFEIGAAVGATRWPEDGTEASQLLARVEIAVARANQQEADVVLFDERFDVATPRRLALLSDLRAAIDDEAIDIHVQPKVDLATGAVTGAEALARWTHPELGFIPPSEFIPLVEQAGLVGRLTRLVLARSADTAADLRRLGLAVPIAVNLSVRDLLDPSLPGAVDTLLRRRELPGSLLEVEITEGAMVVDFDTSLATLQRLRERGLTIAVDDYGTGYSSLTYLHRLPVDCLKIDRSFIKDLATDPTAAAIVRSSIRLAHDLGLSVVAEGVEDDETLERLTALGCDQAQGYLLARPMPATAFLMWMIDHHTGALRRTSEQISTDLP